MKTKLKLRNIFTGRVVVGIILPLQREMSNRLIMNLAPMEPFFAHLLISTLNEKDEGTIQWKEAQQYESMRQFLKWKCNDVYHFYPTHLFLLAPNLDIPPEMIPVLLTNYEADIVCHSYPELGIDKKVKRGLGCIMIRANVLERFSFTENTTKNSIVDIGEIFWKWVNTQKDLKVIELDDVFNLIPYNYDESD